ncbi:MBL fold metallo-hydrolase [Lichenihabitans psoromatis]|uniref:MBL fold metallo-hydrolase n=1 Tax=Lichenihabitans psoromatis TaxID=2528642 RepID=UPI001035702D|nr:MBL fold metallo-hydrolase [Lichenihabitans psoromatis]
MRFCIHRGTQEIGGSCVELEAQGVRILLDLGQPLYATEPTPDLLPNVPGLSKGEDPSLLGIVLSHSHRDHWGLIPLACPDLPVTMGAATHRIMQAAASFVPGMAMPSAVRIMADRETFDLGPFRITPFTVDHSAYDAYALLVEADGQRLFYSGDLRAHGRKGALFGRMVRTPPAHVDVLLLEGTTLGRPQRTAGLPTEAEIEERFVDTFAAGSGLVLVCASAQNIDRMVSIYRAAKRTGRTLLIDLYAAEMLRATGNPNIPQSFWPNVALFTPQYQRRQIMEKSLFAILDRHKSNRLFPEALKARAPDLVMLFRPAMLYDLQRADCLSGASAVWSQWDGYLAEDRGVALRAALDTANIPLTAIHTSGHASLVDLQRLAAAMKPKSIVPIHSLEGHNYPLWFDNVAACADGEWKEI